MLGCLLIYAGVCRDARWHLGARELDYGLPNATLSPIEHDAWVKMVSDDIHCNVSAIVRGKATRHMCTNHKF